MNEWVREFPGAVTVCDPEGIVLEMNDWAKATFQKSGDGDLVGSNLLDCHPGQSRQKLEKMLRTKRMHSYTIEKNGVKKLIYQTPWFKDGKYAGFVELSLEIPAEMPHFVRPSV